MDMLISLYGPTLATPQVAIPGLICRRPLAPEHDLLVDWVARTFSAAWASEVRAALANRPTGVVVAIRSAALVGFCCRDATALGFVGPIGVTEGARDAGIGAMLLLACLHDMRAMGYAYAIAGAVGAPRFFERVAGATAIAGSSSGIYSGMLKA